MFAQNLPFLIFSRVSQTATHMVDMSSLSAFKLVPIYQAQISYSICSCLYHPSINSSSNSAQLAQSVCVYYGCSKKGTRYKHTTSENTTEFAIVPCDLDKLHLGLKESLVNVWIGFDLIWY